MTLLDRVGGRKFVVAASTGFLTCVLVWFGKISGEVFATVILGTVGAFIAGNVVESINVPLNKAARAKKDS